jgi:hypothetical protein
VLPRQLGVPVLRPLSWSYSAPLPLFMYAYIVLPNIQ